MHASERGLTLANARYKEGYSGFQRVLDAQRSVFAQTEQAVVNQGNHIRAVVGLYKALGGGWERKPLTETISPRLKNRLKKRTDWGDLLDSSATAVPEQKEGSTTDGGVSQHE